MGLQSELGFDAGPPNPVQRGLQVVGATKPGSWLFQRTLYRLDRPLYRWTDGRVTVPGVVTGIPVILLTTTGAKSGLQRTMPVMATPIGADLAILGTNFGQPKAPAWVANLQANPHAQVTWHDRSVSAVARPATADERERIWQVAISFYRGFAEYRKRITDRPVRIYVLQPAHHEARDQE